MIEHDSVVALDIQHIRNCPVCFPTSYIETESNSTVIYHHSTMLFPSSFISLIFRVLRGAMPCHAAQLWQALLGLSWLRHVTEPSAAG